MTETREFTFDLAAFKNAADGEAAPELSKQDADLESWDGLLEGSDPKKISEHLGIKLVPFDAKEGHEHQLFRNEEGTQIIKLDKLPVDEDIARERMLVHQTFHDLFPKQIPQMHTSFSVEGGSGIVVDRVPKHDLYDKALQDAQQGDKILLRRIRQNSFMDTVVPACETAGIPLVFDGSERENYIIKPDGTQVLIDSIWTSGEQLTRPDVMSNVSTFMKNREMPVETQNRVMKRLNTLKEVSSPKSREMAVA